MWVSPATVTGLPATATAHATHTTYTTQHTPYTLHTYTHHVLVVAAVFRVGRSEDCRTCIQSGRDAGLSDRHRLLLHHL